MADGRTAIDMVSSELGPVSILARPWRTGARGSRHAVAHPAIVSILARPWRTGALNTDRLHIRVGLVSILARPWRTGARGQRLAESVLKSMFQSSPVHGGRAHLIPPRRLTPNMGFNPRPSMADGRTLMALRSFPENVCFNPRPSMADGRTGGILG